MKYEVKFTNQSKKDLKLAKKQNKHLDELYGVIEKLADDKILEEKYHDHNLHGKEYEGTRECHIESDWLLVYGLLEILDEYEKDSPEHEIYFAQIQDDRARNNQFVIEQLQKVGERQNLVLQSFLSAKEKIIENTG